MRLELTRALVPIADDMTEQLLDLAKDMNVLTPRLDTHLRLIAIQTATYSIKAANGDRRALSNMRYVRAKIALIDQIITNRRKKAFIERVNQTVDLMAVYGTKILKRVVVGGLLV